MQMNDQNKQPIDDLSPDALMTDFSRSRVGLSLIASLVFHVVFIGALSLPAFLFPEAPEQQSASAEADERAAEVLEQGANGAGEGDAGQTDEDGQADADADDGEGAGEGEGDGEDGLSPVERRVQETADPDEIPDQPDDLDFSVDDVD
jgi:hypothetical protein